MGFARADSVRALQARNRELRESNANLEETAKRAIKTAGEAAGSIDLLVAEREAAEARCDIAEQAIIAANQAADQAAQEHRAELSAQRDKTAAVERELARANAEIDDLKCRLAAAEVLSQRAAGFIDRVHEEDLLKRQGPIEPRDLPGPSHNHAYAVSTPTVFTEDDGYGHRRERAVRWPNFGGHRA